MEDLLKPKGNIQQLPQELLKERKEKKKLSLNQNRGLHS